MKRLLALVLSVCLMISLAAVAGAEGGRVYYLNFKPEADTAWQELAQTYTELTGVEVKVVTAASGTYDQTLTAEMDKGAAAPTLVQMGSNQAIKTWGYTLLDLNGTDLINEMTTDEFNLKDDEGRTLAIGFCYEAFGIIVNKTLLAKAGYALEDIKDFASLKAVADDIHSRAADLGFDAFTSAGLDGSSSWRFSGHLSNMPLFYEFRDDGIDVMPETIKGTYLDAYKNIWDLYMTDSAADPAKLASATGDQAEAEFGNGQAVFFQNGTWEWNNLTTVYNLTADDLAMIPIYCGVEGEENAALCAGTENCWAINSSVSEEDQKATLDFLKWVVTSEEGTKMMAEQLGEIPFKGAQKTENVFFQNANAYLADGKYAVTWAFTMTPDTDNWRAGVVSALTQYAAGVGTWDDVVSEFVDGWATCYQAIQ